MKPGMSGRSPPVWGTDGATGWPATPRSAASSSVNLTRALHPDWFKADLGHLFDLLARGQIRPRVTERVTLDAVPDAHRRLEQGGLDGKLVLCPRLSA
jgi:NADPH:quinone reductase-like Zn-dependent oxidoreductase